MAYRIHIFNLLAFFALLRCTHSLQSKSTVNRGYSLGFQSHTIAGTRTGFVDPSDPGWMDLDRNFTVAFWMQRYAAGGYVISLSHAGDPTHFTPLWLFQGILFGAQWDLPSHFGSNEWFHIAITSSPAQDTLLYVDGVVANSIYSADSTFKGIEKLAFNIGAHLYTFHDSDLLIGERNGFNGDIDDFGLWSRALSQQEVRYLIDATLSNEEVASDPSIILYYNFNTQLCNDASGTPLPTSEIMAMDCPESGFRVIPNLGVSGSKYDLLVGQMDNSMGKGREYMFSTEKAGTPTTRFELPLPTKSTPPLDGLSLENLEIPSVHYALPGNLIRIPLNPNASYTVSQLASQGQLFGSLDETLPISSNNTALGSNELAFKLHPNTATATLFILQVTPVSTGIPESHPVHVWPYLQPIVKLGGQDSRGISTVEDKSVMKGLCTKRLICYLRPPGRGVAKITSVVSTGEMWWMNATGSDQRVTINSTGLRYDSAVNYVPAPNVFGKDADSFEMKVVDPRSMLESLDKLVLPIDILESDDRPYVVSRMQVVEEDSAGVSIVLEGGDYEPNSVGIAITSLPTKGDLYVQRNRVSNGTVEWVKVTKPYGLYFVSDTRESYPTEVVKVSSFWGNPPGTSYHPMNVLGRPHCGSNYGECVADGRLLNDKRMEVDDIVRVDQGSALNVNLDSIQVVGTIVQVNNPGTDEVTYDIEVMTMYKNDGAGYPNLTACYLNRNGAFPEDCDPQLHIDHRGRLILLNMTPSSLASMKNGVHAAYNAKYVPGVHLEGGDKSAAYGAQYYYDHKPAEYFENTDPAYDEYFEVKFREPMFLVDLEIGEPRGGGSIVGIRVMNPDGNWDLVYSGLPLLQEHEKTTAKRIHHWFAKQLCRPFYKSNHFRFEINTQAISEYNYFDYIQRSGSHEMQYAALEYPFNQVKYVPHPDAEGEDSFEFESTDCGGNRLRRSVDRATVSISITSSPDPPTTQWFEANEEGESSENVVIVHDIQTVLVKTSSTVFIRLDGIDVDEEDVVTLKITDIQDATESDTLFQSNGDPVVLNEVLTVVQETVALGGGSQKRFSSLVQFDAGICYTIENRKLSFTFTATDSTMSVSQGKVVLEIVCGELPGIFNFLEISERSQLISTALGISGIIVATVAMLFNIVFRRHPIVRMTSPRINIFICLGVVLVNVFLVLKGQRIQNLPNCSAEDFKDSMICDKLECCAGAIASQCMTPTAVGSIGILLAFGMLIGKTERIIRLLTTKDLMKRTVTDTLVMTSAMVIISPLLMLLCIWFGADTPRLEFAPSQPVLKLDTQEVESFLTPMCSGGNYDTFMALLVGYCSIVICYGAVQAYKVRNVHIKQANDSKSIAAALYNIFVLGCISLAIQYAITERDPSHVMTTVFVWLCANIVIVALFGPRAYEVATGVTSITTSASKKSMTRVASASTKSPHTSESKTFRVTPAGS